MEAKPEAVKQRTLQLASVSVSNLTRTGMRLLLDNTLRAAADAGMETRYTYLPRDRRTVSSLEFDDAYMKDTFRLGYERALSGTLWKEGPQP